jgi:hypothetical protein
MACQRCGYNPATAAPNTIHQATAADINSKRFTGVIWYHVSDILAYGPGALPDACLILHCSGAHRILQRCSLNPRPYIRRIIWTAETSDTNPGSSYFAIWFSSNQAGEQAYHYINQELLQHSVSASRISRTDSDGTIHMSIMGHAMESPKDRTLCSGSSTLHIPQHVQGRSPLKRQDPRLFYSGSLPSQS